MDVAAYWQQVFQTERDLTQMFVEGRQAEGHPPLGPVKRNPRTGNTCPTVEVVYLCSADHVGRVNPGGQPGFVVMANLKNAAVCLNEFGMPWRLATAAEIQGFKDHQARNLSIRKLEDLKADRSRPFVVQVPGE